MDSLEIANIEIPRQSQPTRKKRRKRFETRWVKLSLRWVKALRRSESINTYRLAHTILFEAFKHEQVGGEVVLSTEVTKLSATTRKRAIKELVKLGLIRVRRNGNKAVRVVHIYY
jgi:hypothetical protein